MKVAAAPEETVPASFPSSEPSSPSPGVNNVSSAQLIANHTSAALTEAGSINRHSTARWQWFRDKENAWKDYSAKESIRIERAYDKGDAMVRLKRDKDAIPIEIFFYDMIQYDPVTLNSRKIRVIARNPVCHWIRRGFVVLCRSLEKGRWQRFSFKQHQEVALLQKHDKEHSSLLNPARAEMYYKRDGFCQKFAKSRVTFSITTLVVILNSIWLGIEVEHNNSANVFQAKAHFQVPEHFFCLYFTGEALMRFGAFERKLRCLTDFWFVFDALLAILIIVETWLIPLILLSSDDTRGKAVKRAGILRLVRLLRLTQLFRLLQFTEMLTLIKGLVSAAHSVVYTLLLLFLLIYVFAVVLRSFAQEIDGLPKQFDDLGSVMQTLLLQGTFVDDVTDLLVEVYPVSPFVFFFFVAFIFLSAYAVLNLLIGILCDVVARVRRKEESDALATNLRHTVFEILDAHDKDEDKQISVEEWDLIMKNPEMHLILKGCQVDIRHLIDMRDILFVNENTDATTMDLTANEKSISFEEVLEVILRLREGCAATVGDIVDLRQYIADRLDHLHFKIQKNAARVERTSKLAHMNHEMLVHAANPNLEANGISTQTGATMSQTVKFESDTSDRLHTPPMFEGATCRASDFSSSWDSQQAPPWADEILARLGALNAKQDALQKQVSSLRAEVHNRIGPQPSGVQDRPPTSVVPTDSTLSPDKHDLHSTAPCDAGDMRAESVPPSDPSASPDQLDSLSTDVNLAHGTSRKDILHIPT